MAISLYICFPADLIPQPGSLNDLAGCSVCTHKPVDSLCCCDCSCSGQLVDPEHHVLSVSDDAHPTSLFCAAHLDSCEHMFMFGVCVRVSVHAHRLTSWTHTWPRNLLNSAANSILNSYTFGGEPGCLQEIGPVWPPDSGTCNMPNVLQTNEKKKKFH